MSDVFLLDGQITLNFIRRNAKACIVKRLSSKYKNTQFLFHQEMGKLCI